MRKQTLIFAIILTLFVLPQISALTDERYIVELKDNQINPSLSLNTIEEIHPSELNQVAGVRISPKKRIIVVSNLSIEEIESEDSVIRAEPDYRFSSLVQSNSWNYESIGIDSQTGSLGQGVRIAVLDTGVNYNLLNILNGYDFVNEDSDPLDDNGHGTFVTQILRNPGTNFPLNQAEIYSVKVLDENGDGFVSDIVEGINWAINNNIDIILMSLGGNEDSSFLRDAIQQANSQGITIIAAAGNENAPEVVYPARYPETISVGSINQNLQRSSFSNYGSILDFVAPGENILITDGQDSYLGEGTSFSVPHVGVVAASYLSDNPSFSNADLKNKLISTAQDLGSPGKDDEFGWGLVRYGGGISSSNDDTIVNLTTRLDNLEIRVSLVEEIVSTIQSSIDNLLSSIVGLVTISNEHEARISNLENGVISKNESDFPNYLNYLSSSDRKRILCGLAEEAHLEHIEDLGYICDITYRTLSSGREIVRCGCKVIR